MNPTQDNLDPAAQGEDRPKGLAGVLLRYLVATISFTFVLYLTVALVLSTAEERRLKKENQLYGKLYAEMVARQQLIGEVLEGLEQKDNTIYRKLFETDAPTPGMQSATDVIAENDALSENFYLASASSTSGSVMRMARKVEADFKEALRILSRDKKAIPPLTRPLHHVSYVQTGASVGRKHNPVYKLKMQHDGLDLVAPQGSHVHAAAAGVVKDTRHSGSGLGNVVEIDHGNGYVTRYCLLVEVRVKKGMKVKQGEHLGRVGISTSVTAPHLHYEVLHDGKVVDPVNHLFASIGPDEYAKMLYMSSRTLQSMD